MLFRARSAPSLNATERCFAASLPSSAQIERFLRAFRRFAPFPCFLLFSRPLARNAACFSSPFPGNHEKKTFSWRASLLTRWRTFSTALRTFRDLTSHRVRHFSLENRKLQGNARGVPQTPTIQKVHQHKLSRRGGARVSQGMTYKTQKIELLPWCFCTE